MAATHYTIDGVQHARVSYVISQLHPSSHVFPKTAAAAAALGTAMHASIHAMLLGATDDFPLKAQALAALSTVLRGATLVAAEHLVANRDARIAGTIDALFRRPNGNLVLVDWKRTRALFPAAAETYQLQLSLYAALLAAAGLPVAEHMLILLHPDNATFRHVPVPPVDVSVYLANARFLHGSP